VIVRQSEGRSEDLAYLAFDVKECVIRTTVPFAAFEVEHTLWVCSALLRFSIAPGVTFGIDIGMSKNGGV